MTKLSICPRCKKRSLDVNDCGESGLYHSRHLICVPCFHEEFDQIDAEGTNDLPDVLASYGPANDFSEEYY